MHFKDSTQMYLKKLALVFKNSHLYYFKILLIFIFET